MDTELKCDFCGHTQAWHKENQANVHHGFVTPNSGGLAKINEREKKAPTNKEVVREFQGDPALRIALYRAGLISPEAVSRAEEELRSGKTVIVVTPGS